MIRRRRFSRLWVGVGGFAVLRCPCRFTWAVAASARRHPGYTCPLCRAGVGRWHA